MPTQREFDCVEMKDRIQAELLEEKQRLGEEVQAKRHREWLERSDEPLARWWRAIGQKADGAGRSSRTS